MPKYLFFLFSLLLSGCSFVVHDVLGFPEENEKAPKLSFSHQSHIPRMLSQSKKPWETEKKDAEEACIACHQSLIDDGVSFSLPGHSECKACHPQVDGNAGCELCHGTSKPTEKNGAPVFSTGELRFSHKTHTEGTPQQSCLDCHANIERSSSSKDINTPSMWDCRECHGGVKAMKGASWACEVCHKEYREGDTPPSQLTLHNENAMGHEQGFLTNHGRAAKKPGAGCDRCHEDTSCNRCHSLTPPRDHNLRFTKNLHGREATIDRERCAACHESGFCAGCHSIGPQTHFDNGFRLEGGHAQQARRAIRSCLACHQFVGFCDTPGCHLITEDRAGNALEIR